MKKIIKVMAACALAGVMATGFAACGGGGGGGEESTVDAKGNTIVKIMFHVDSKSAEGLAYKRRIDAFNAKYTAADSEIKIKASATFVARTGGASAYETSLSNMQREGTLPDIITFDAPKCAKYASEGLLYDITDLIPADEKADFITLNEYNNKLYGLPIQESSAGFYYNKNLFNQAGITQADIGNWTYTNFTTVCSKLRAANITPVDMRLDATKDETAPYLLYPFIYASGGDYVSADGFTSTGHLNSSGSVRGFQFLKDLVSNNYTSYSIGATDFFDGKVGMYLSSGWTIPDLDNKYPKIFPDRDSWGLLPYPSDVSAASATGSWCYGITDNGKDTKEAAAELLKWMSSAESSDVITAATGMIPARYSVNKNYPAGSPEYVLYNQLQTTGKARPVTVGYSEFSTTFNDIIAALGGTANLQSLLNTKATSLDSQLRELR